MLVGDTAKIETRVELNVEETAIELEGTTIEDLSSPGVFRASRTRKIMFGLAVAFPTAIELFWKYDASLVS